MADLSDRHDLFRLEALLAGPDGLVVDVLVNNAGRGRTGEFPRAARRDLQAEVDLNITATMGLTHAVLPGMLARRRGTLVNVGSVAGYLPSPGSSYGPTKAWVAAFTDSLVPVLEGTGVAAVAVVPGYMRTGWHDAPVPAGLTGRLLCAEPEQVVDTCLADLDRGRALSVPGPLYRPLVDVLEMPRRALRLASRVAGVSRQHKLSPEPAPAPAPVAARSRPRLPDLPSRPAQRVEPPACLRASGSGSAHFVATQRSTRERRARATAAARSRTSAGAPASIRPAAPVRTVQARAVPVPPPARTSSSRSGGAWRSAGVVRPPPRRPPSAARPRGTRARRGTRRAGSGACAAGTRRSSPAT